MSRSAHDRRRQDFYGRLRRAAYGLALVACSAQAKGDAQNLRQTLSNWWPNLQFGASLSAPRSGFMLTPTLAQSLRLARHAVSADQQALAFSGKLHIDDGLGLAVAMPDMGALYVNVYCADDDRSPGQWSLGDSLSTYRSGAAPVLWPRDQWAVLRGARPENQPLVFAPQLVMNFDELLGKPSRFEARLQYAPWGPLYARPGGDQRMPQLILSWPF